MTPQTAKTGKYTVTYFCKEEFHLLEKEIFRDEIYDIDLKTSHAVIYDLGSHIGMSILYFKMKYPRSKIVAFEPNPNTFILLEENIFSNKLEDISLYNIALSKKEGERDLYIDKTGYDAFSTASFTKDAWNGKQKTIPIKVKSEKLSTYLNENIDLLKIDTEGEELNILKDLDESNKLELVKNVILEYHPKKSSQLKKILSILQKNKFSLSYMYEGQSTPKPIEELILVKGEKRV